MENSTSDGLAALGTRVVHDVKDQALGLLDRGKIRSEALVHSRRRKELLRDLGEVTYDAHVAGDETFGTPRRDILLAELDGLEPAETETPPT